MPDMKPHERRRQNLLAVIEEKFAGNKGQFADFVGKKRPQIYRLFSDSPISRRDIGEDLAREFETLLGLSTYALDNEAADDTGPHLLQSASDHKADYDTTTPAVLEPLIADIKRAYNSRSLSIEAINSLRSLVNSMQPQQRDISTTPEDDLGIPDFLKKREAKSSAVNPPTTPPTPDKNDELDLN